MAKDHVLPTCAENGVPGFGKVWNHPNALGLNSVSWTTTDVLHEIESPLAVATIDC
jgi:hypothetical protein